MSTAFASHVTPSSSSPVTQPRKKRKEPVQATKVLIIDDDMATIDVLSYRLEKQGYKVLTATTAKNGLDQIGREKPNLILLDLGLPDMNGFEVCETLVDSPETCTIPVIIISGLERSDIVRACRASGSCYFLRKPYDPNVLLMLIQQTLDQWTGE